MQCLAVANAREVAADFVERCHSQLHGGVPLSIGIDSGGRLCKSDIGGASEADWSHDVRLTHTRTHTHARAHTHTLARAPRTW